MDAKLSRNPTVGEFLGRNSTLYVYPHRTDEGFKTREKGESRSVSSGLYRAPVRVPYRGEGHSVTVRRWVRR